jgi:4-hydroxy-tetrahydrodipicolinate synthase
VAERIDVIQAGVEAAGELVVLAQTGCANLTETIALTRSAYEIGADATVIVPPFYYKNVTTQGLFAYYQRVLAEAFPEDGKLLLYHIPQVTHVPASHALLERLEAFKPEWVVGIKDSSADLEHLMRLCKDFPHLHVMSGTERLFLKGLEAGASGCITAPSNLFAPLSVAVYHAFLNRQRAEELQAVLTSARSILEKYAPFPAPIKYLLSQRYQNEGWEVRPPLEPLNRAKQAALKNELARSEFYEWIPWLREIQD